MDDDAGTGQRREENCRDGTSTLLALQKFVEKVDNLLRILNLKLNCHLPGVLTDKELANVETILDNN